MYHDVHSPVPCAPAVWCGRSPCVLLGVGICMLTLSSTRFSHFSYSSQWCLQLTWHLPAQASWRRSQFCTSSAKCSPAPVWFWRGTLFVNDRPHVHGADVRRLVGRVPTGSCEPTVPTRAPSRAPPRLTRAPDSGRRPADSGATSGDESGRRGPSRPNEARDWGRWMCRLVPTRRPSRLQGMSRATGRTDSVRERGRDLRQKCPTRDPHEGPSRTEFRLWARSYL